MRVSGKERGISRVRVAVGRVSNRRGREGRERKR